MTREDVISVVLYKNRKLYCKQRSGYITLRDIYLMFCKGVKLSIQEHETQKNITRDIIFKSVYLCGTNYETKLRLLSKMGDIS